MSGYSHFKVLALLVAGLTLVPWGAAFAVDVTWCGQTVPAGEIGVVQDDLSCPPELAYDALMLEDDAVLDLNGHTVSGGVETVACTGNSGSCTIRGPGVISGPTETAVDAHIGVRRLILENLTISDTGTHAVHPNGSCTVVLRNVLLERNGNPAVTARRIEVDNVTARDNVGYVFSGQVRGQNVMLDGNGGGITTARSSRLRNLTVTNSTFAAIVTSKALRLEDSTLTNNDTAGSGIDLLTKKKPRLLNTTCSRSRVCLELAGGQCTHAGDTWGVCTDD